MKKVFTTSTLAVACLLMVAACNKAIDSNDADRSVKELKSGNATVFTKTVILSPEEELHTVVSDAMGVATIRITADKKMHSKVIVNNLEEDDALRFAHIHTGAQGANGGVYVFLCATADDFGKNIVRQLTDAQFDDLLNPEKHFYVNAHSVKFGMGVVRGQIR